MAKSGLGLVKSAEQNIADTFVMIQVHMPEQCRFDLFQKSVSTESKYMYVIAAERTASRLLGVRVSAHKAAQRVYRRGISKVIPTCSIVLPEIPHPAARSWVDAVLWLYWQLDLPVPRGTKNAIWNYYASFYPEHFGGANWPKSLVSLNNRCRQTTLEKILQQHPHLGYIQKLLNAVPDICHAAKPLLMEELNRLCRKFRVSVEKKRGTYTLVESAPKSKMRTPVERNIHV